MKLFEKLPNAMLAWYDAGHRELPWRQTRDPYRIWISEIMLQQTRVEAVRGYYARFLDVCPDVQSLANTSDEVLHKLWEGLGYYSRVRNLKKAAIEIMESYGGAFPKNYEQVLALPGIGEYTAGAICSIAWDDSTPAVDGNVLRVVARLTDDPTPIEDPKWKRNVRDRLREVYPKRAGDFTQSLMELGATLCGPNRKPQCAQCPCRSFCLGHLRGTADSLPVKTPKRPRRTEEKTVFILQCEDRFAIEKRPDTGLLAGLWQFPDCPGRGDVAWILEQVEQFGLKPSEITKLVERKHVFTHITWEMCGAYVQVAEENKTFAWRTMEEIRELAALPTAYRQFVEMD